MGTSRKPRAAPGADDEAELLERITNGDLALGPVVFWPDALHIQDGPADGALRARVEGSDLERHFVYEYKPNWTRKGRFEAADRLRRAYGEQYVPLLIAPYLSDKILDELMEERISAIDVCGNGLVVDPPDLFVLRSGAKKQKHLAAPARPSIYQSSNVATLVPRAFLLQRVFPTTTAILEACHARIVTVGDTAKPLTLPTISKALRQLDDDLVTERRGRERRLRDPERLLQHLQHGFRLPSAPPVLLKAGLPVPELWQRLHDQRPRLRFVATGRASASHYAGLAGPDRVRLYVSDPALARQVLEAKPTAAFPDLELVPTHDESAYFDAREDQGVVWSSPVQCYLELTRIGADPREQDVAEKLRAQILDAVRLSR